VTDRDGSESAATEEGDKRRFIPRLEAYTMFHASQMEGVPEYEPPQHGERSWQKPEVMQPILDASGIEIRTVADRACYVAATDVICLPPVHASDTADLWGEGPSFSHATAAPSRLGRKLSTKFGSEDYAFEELIVSLATSMVGPEPGIAVNVENQASYVEDYSAPFAGTGA
jgi:antirestriction protein ArdC